MQVPHPIHRRFWAEELVRLRRADERQRHAASQRRGRIDPNPHQIDAVIFALRRIPQGGCILADEVGLGKTIEAGLVMAQLLAEGASRILLVLPKPLLGQWKDELYTLFGLETREGGPNPNDFMGEGLFVVGREFAGSEKGAGLLRSSQPFDLCVIDEAHEIFAGIYKRFGRDGDYDFSSDEARMAHHVRSFLGTTPVLLLTATPIQNNLTELWGLVQYVEPTGTLLGTIATFRDLFCEPGQNDRVLVPQQTDELRRRINTVCQRTLRRQAQEFLEKPFTRRRARLFEYEMSPAERSLHDDVTDYLLEPNLQAFRGQQRRLLLISFLRQMASSWPALAASLRNVARRLQGMLTGDDAASDDAARAMVVDLEDDEEADEETVTVGQLDRGLVQAELARVEDFIQRAKSLPGDAKAQRLLEAVRLVLERARDGQGSGKVVIFTESLTTQEYLRQLLQKHGLVTDDEITLFRGVNDSPRATAALRAWKEEIEVQIPPINRPSRQVAVRLALVHEFRTRSKIFISTESGAKGLNLQFCDTLVNYDLPWNPQRIEQRIGRCHRYGQKHDVTVINFLAKENEAQRLTFQILSEKLELFGQVLDATDVVLHEPTTDAPETLATTFGADVEGELRRIWERARSQSEVSGELRRLSQSLDSKRKTFEDTHRRTASLIESRFDDSVRQVFRQIQDEVPKSLAELDRQIELVVTGYLAAIGVAFTRRADPDGRVFLTIPAAEQLPEAFREGGTVAIGHARDLGDAEPLHLGHVLVSAAVAEARAATPEPVTDTSHGRGVRFHASTAATEAWRGRRGRLVVTRLTHRGFEPVERLLVLALLEPLPGDAAGPVQLPADNARELLLCPVGDAPVAPVAIDELQVTDSIEEAVFCDQLEAREVDERRFREMLEQVERYVEDQLLVLRRGEQELERKLIAARRTREAALGPDARSRADDQVRRLEREQEETAERIRRFESRDDEEYRKWRDFAQQRRSVAPLVERILDVPFEVE